MSGSVSLAQLGPVDSGGGQLALGNLLTPLNPKSISFEATKNDLVQWALNKPSGVAWGDWFDTDDGTIIAEWIAGLAVFRKIAETMRIREASLDYAQLESSIYELAFNRGLLVSPAAAPVLELTLRVPPGAAVSVNPADLVGTQGNYELYSLEGKTLRPEDTLRVAVGHLNTFRPTFSTLERFRMFEVPLKDRFVARELESFVAGGRTVPLVAEPSNVGGFSNTFLLRRAVPSSVRIYVGNGVMGWYDPTVASIVYTCLSYGRDVATSLSYTPQVAIGAKLTDFAQAQAPSFDPDKETLRAIARYYPIDGRIVQDGDYESVIRNYYGGVLHDVYSYNTDPEQQVELLPNPAFGFATPQAAQQIAGITALVDGKRALGMPVRYRVLDPASGRSMALHFVVPASQYSYALQLQVNDLLKLQLFRFAREPALLSAVNFATQLSARFGVQFRPLDPTVTLQLGPADFLSALSIGVSPG